MSEVVLTGGGIEKPSSERKYTKEDLKEMQSWDLNRKIQVTQTRILEWLTKWGNQCYISFSGGKDSTVLLDLVRRVNPNIVAVYVDTGLEYPEVKQFIKKFDNVITLRPKMSFRQVIEKYGYPVISKEVAQKIYDARKCPGGKTDSRFEPNNEHATKYGKGYSMEKWKWLRDSDIPISHKCCNVMKKSPAKIFEHKTGLKPIVGTMACESTLRKTEWMKTGCNSFDGDRPMSKPMSFWTKQDVLEYIRRYGLKYASVYGDIVEDEDGKLSTTGCDRTGCVFCLFGVTTEKDENRIQRLKRTHPKLWEYCLRDWDQGGLGLKRVMEVIGCKWE